MFRLFHLVLLALTVVLGVIGVSRLNYNVEILDLLPQGMRGVEGTRILKDTYEKAHQLVLTVDAPNADMAAAATDSLAEALTAQVSLIRRVLTKPSWEADPQQIGALGAYAWVNAPPEKFTAMRESLAPELLRPVLEKNLAELASALDAETIGLGAYDPLGLMGAAKDGVDPALLRGGATSEFSSADGKFRVLYVDPVTLPSSYRETAAWIDRVRTEGLAPWQAAHPEWSTATFGVTGSPAFRAEISMGMESDMNQSIGGITFIVGFLFWLLHRTLKPLLLLMLSLLCAMLLTLGLAGLLYGSLNVMSMGFAAILMGMIEDFGVIGLHDWLQHPRATFWETHRRVFPGIFWSALTSALVFGSLAFSVMPGIAQLGVLTGVGILVGAAVMLYGFLPLAIKFSPRHVVVRDLATGAAATGWRAHLPALSAAVLLIGSVGVLGVRGLPGVYRESNILHPTHCAAMANMLRLQDKMQPPELLGEWLPVLVHGSTEAALTTALTTSHAELARAQTAGEISNFYLPESLAPNLANQAQNLSQLPALLALQATALQTAADVGFSDDGLILAKQIFSAWAAMPPPTANPPTLLWPAPALLEGSLGKILQLKSGSHNASGFVRFPPGVRPAEAALVARLEAIPGLYPGGWRYLNDSIKPLLSLEIKRVCLPTGVLLLVLLGLVFRNVREILLVLTSLTFSGLILLALMSACEIDWNFVNIGAVPLSLGLGLDFNIHMIYSLRRLDGTAEASGQSIGRALAYCGLSTGLGFGALAMSGNRGLITFGQCAMIGVLATLFTAAFLLPWAWQKCRRA